MVQRLPDATSTSGFARPFQTQHHPATVNLLDRPKQKPISRPRIHNIILTANPVAERDKPRAASATLNQQTQYGYDLAGNKISQTDANNHTTRYVFDVLNRRTKRTLPAGQFETYGCDDAGNKISRTNFNGKTTTLGYDALNRSTSRTPDASFVGAPAITYLHRNRQAQDHDRCQRNDDLQLRQPRQGCVQGYSARDT